MEARRVRWERVRRLSPRNAVVTGEAPAAESDDAGDSDSTVPTTAEARRLDELRGRPLLVFVHTDPDLCDGQCKGACQRYFDVDAELFGDPKISLAVRAFRTVWITPEDGAAEPLLADTGDELPRLVLIDVARERTVVVDRKELKARRLFAALRKISDRFYEERLDGLVKKHLKLLDAYDKLAVREAAIQERLTRTTDLDKIHDLEDELDDLRDARQDLDRDVTDLWRLTLRDL